MCMWQEMRSQRDDIETLRDELEVQRGDAQDNSSEHEAMRNAAGQRVCHIDGYQCPIALDDCVFSAPVLRGCDL